MNRTKTGLDFTAKDIKIEGHVGDDIRFGVKLTIDKEPLPLSEYSVETFIYDEDGTNISSEHNFTNEPQDGIVKFKLEDPVTTAMGAGNWRYAIVITLINQDDYDRSYINGPLILIRRSDFD